ncbi:hypothetical protein HanRHA438_Chr09g0388251 [Helianthus annuus]|nr:hypothetical protein HanRHA438_Chr09g0388251 [Helianthus annuus]
MVPGTGTGFTEPGTFLVPVFTGFYPQISVSNCAVPGIFGTGTYFLGFPGPVLSIPIPKRYRSVPSSSLMVSLKLVREKVEKHNRLVYKPIRAQTDLGSTTAADNKQHASQNKWPQS